MGKILDALRSTFDGAGFNTIDSLSNIHRNDYWYAEPIMDAMAYPRDLDGPVLTQAELEQQYTARVHAVREQLATLSMNGMDLHDYLETLPLASDAA